MEQFSTSRHALGFNRGIANSCKYVVPKGRLEGRSAQLVVEEALASLILRLSGLRVGITGEDTNNACFVRVPSMNLQDFIQWTTIATGDLDEYDEQVLRGVKNNLEQLWLDPENRPPWQVLVVENEAPVVPNVIELDIGFAVHHAIADGKSTTVFHTELLRLLNDPPQHSPELKDHVLTFTEPPVLVPSQEDLVPCQISWSFFLQALWSQLGPAWLKPTPLPQPWTGNPITPEPQTLNLRLVTIAPETVPQLILACRAHNTTLSGILHVLILASFARRIPADVASSFSGQTPISLLPWAKVPPGVRCDLGRELTDLNTGTKRIWDASAVSRLREAFREADTSSEERLIWPFASTWRSEMKAKIGTLPNDDVVGLLRYVGSFDKHWLDKLGKARDATWEISNVGSIRGFTMGGEDAWSITRSLFTQPANVVGAALNVNVAGVVDGPVDLVLSWQDTIIDTATVESIAQDLRNWFDEFGRKGSFGVFTQEEEPRY